MHGTEQERRFFQVRSFDLPEQGMRPFRFLLGKRRMNSHNNMEQQKKFSHSGSFEKRNSRIPKAS
jgi:hypothetical protein